MKTQPQNNKEKENEEFRLALLNMLEDMKESQERLKTQAEIMKNVAEGIYLIGLKNFKIKWTNRRFEQMFGYNPGEMIGMEVSKVNAPTPGVTPEQEVFGEIQGP